jgi:hypothetical protein
MKTSGPFNSSRYSDFQGAKEESNSDYRSMNLGKKRVYVNDVPKTIR